MFRIGAAILACGLVALATLAATPPVPAGPAQRPVPSAPQGGPQVVRKSNVFVLPISGSFGAGSAQAFHLEQLGAEVDKFGPGQTIVLDVDSHSGVNVETYRLARAVEELRKRHRVVFWVKQAVGPLAPVLLVSDGNYFRADGVAGAERAKPTESKQENGTGPSVKFELKGRAALIAAISGSTAGFWIRVGRPYGESELVQGMPLQEGAEVVARPGTLVSFNAETAKKCGLSSGTASDTTELAKHLGLERWEEASGIGRRMATEWEALYKECVLELQKELARLHPSTGDTEERRVILLEVMRKALEWTKKCRTCTDHLGIDSQNVEREIKKLEAELAKQGQSGTKKPSAT